VVIKTLLAGKRWVLPAKRDNHKVAVSFVSNNQASRFNLCKNPQPEGGQDEDF
jgi:hypothetical protein